MPDVNSFADRTDDWEGLLGSCEANPDLFPNIDPFRVPLVGALDKVKALKKQRDQLAGLSQVTTQQLNAAIEEGSEAARRLRRFVMAQLGTKSEHLPQFGIQPIRRRTRRTAKRPTPGAPASPAPGAAAPDTGNPAV